MGINIPFSNVSLRREPVVRLIHNQFVGFRCPNVLRQTLEEIAVDNDMHLSQVIRVACSNLVRASGDTRKPKETEVSQN
jgi:hypothetical protein